MASIILTIEGHGDLRLSHPIQICRQTAEKLEERISMQDLISCIEHEIRMALLDKAEVTVVLDIEDDEDNLHQRLVSFRLWKGIARAVGDGEEVTVTWA